MLAPLVVAALLPTVVTAGVAAAEPPSAPSSERAPRCTIVGTPGPDRLVGTRGRDVICGRGGDDRLLGRGGDDVLLGGSGADRLLGGRGGDSLVGGRGNDLLRGGPGADDLDGRDASRFRDRLRCGAGRADRAAADMPDAVAPDCEAVVQNDAPSGLDLDPSAVAENEPTGTLVGVVTVSDPDAGDTHVLSLVPGEGATDNDDFVLDGDRLLTAAVFDFEADAELGIRIRVEDQDGARFEKPFVVTVADVFENRGPVAADDRFTGTEDTPLDLPVAGPGGPAANDTDADGDPTTVVEVAAADGGSVVLTGDTITFTPAPDLCGTAAGGFDYTVDDGRGATAVAHVTIDLTCTRDVPVAVDDTVTVREDAAPAAVSVLANDRSPDGDPLTVTAATDPAHGTVVVSEGGLTYAPDPDYCNSQTGGSPDTFGYTMTGGDSASVSVTVTCVDDAPVAVDDSLTVTEDDAASPVDVLGNDTDVDAGPMSVVSV
ncbi:Ig-like domain-containing protein, partial [Nocardioides ferulae]|uniref:Ig-like domain-containing protein n=1 Tax=Nocardioides ferulae TaxID=2340821 RepID=UPI0023E8B3A5